MKESTAMSGRRGRKKRLVVSKKIKEQKKRINRYKGLRKQRWKNHSSDSGISVQLSVSITNQFWIHKKLPSLGRLFINNMYAFGRMFCLNINFIVCDSKFHVEIYTGNSVLNFESVRNVNLMSFRHSLKTLKDLHRDYP